MVTRKFRGATYNISISNPDAVSRGVKAISVDGVPIEGNVVSPGTPGQEYNVRVVMG